MSRWGDDARSATPDPQATVKCDPNISIPDDIRMEREQPSRDRQPAAQYKLPERPAMKVSDRDAMRLPRIQSQVAVDYARKDLKDVQERYGMQKDKALPVFKQQLGDRIKVREAEVKVLQHEMTRLHLEITHNKPVSDKELYQIVYMLEGYKREKEAAEKDIEACREEQKKGWLEGAVSRLARRVTG